MNRLRRTRLLLLLALALLGAVVGITLAILRPAGTVRARAASWGPEGFDDATEIEGYAADRRGGRCGLVRRQGGVEILRLPLPDCRAYQAPAVVRMGERTVAVWEHRDGEVAISEVEPPLAMTAASITLIRS